MASYKAPSDGVFMLSCQFGNTTYRFDPSIRPLAIVHFARAKEGHRAGCWADALMEILK